MSANCGPASPTMLPGRTTAPPIPTWGRKRFQVTFTHPELHHNVLLKGAGEP